MLTDLDELDERYRPITEEERRLHPSPKPSDQNWTGGGFNTTANRSQRLCEGRRVNRLMIENERRQAQDGTAGKGEYLCRCDCGKELWVSYVKLYYGSVYSCGCVTSLQRPARDLTGWAMGNVRVTGWDRERGAWLAECSRCGDVAAGEKMDDLKRLGKLSCRELRALRVRARA